MPCRRSISITSKNPYAVASGSGQSSWDHLFKDLENATPSDLKRPLAPRNPKQSMTAREMKAFESMIDMVFDSSNDAEASSERSSDRPNKVDDLFKKLRRHSKKMKWSTEAEDMLDRKKEEMDLCSTDQELLEWANDKVFGEFRQYLEAVLSGSNEAIQQPPTYPTIIALLVRQFRDRYHNPHLALAIFDHARHLSILSYVFGCSTQAYNELIQTRWSSFRDLMGVKDALQEMFVNGVETNAQTRKLVEGLWKDVGTENIWPDHNPESEIGSTLAEIERMMPRARPESTSKRGQPMWDAWKNQGSEGKDASYVFDSWDAPPTKER